MKNDAMNVENEQEVEIDLLRLLKAVKKSLVLIILVGILGGAGGFAYSKLMITPLYRTSFTVFVNNKTSDAVGYSTAVSSSDVSAARYLADTYAEIITGRSVLLEAAQRCGLGSMSYRSLSALVDAKSSSSTQIITVYVKGTSPLNALYLAQAVAQVADGQIAQIVDGSSMRVVDEPYEPTEKFSPSNTKNALIGAVAAAFLVTAIVVIKELLDDRVKDESTLEERYSIIVLGSIPNFESAKKSGNSYYGYGKNK